MSTHFCSALSGFFRLRTRRKSSLGLAYDIFSAKAVFSFFHSSVRRLQTSNFNAVDDAIQEALSSATVYKNYIPAVHNLYFHNQQQLSVAFIDEFSRDFTIFEDFITREDEERLLREVEKALKHVRYEFEQHWDHAIIGYREIEKKDWKNKRNTELIRCVQQFVFGHDVDARPLPHVHILDLHPSGYIKPHIDAVRFCGSAVAGVSLISDAVMRLQKDKAESPVVDVLLKRRSLYIMRNTARYEFTHEILGAAESKFNEVQVPRERRISIMVRSEAEDTARSTDSNIKQVTE